MTADCRSLCAYRSAFAPRDFASQSAEVVKLHHHVVSEFQSDAIELEEREPARDCISVALSCEALIRRRHSLGVSFASR